MHTIIKNITTPIYRNLTLVLIVSIMALTACEGDGSTSPSTISTVETAKRATTDVRDSYGIFTLKTDTGTVTDYHLAVKEKSATAPTAKEMTAGALKRNISPTAIHVLIAQRLNAPMVGFAKVYFADTNQQTLGTDMSGTFSTANKSGFVYDNSATGANAWVKESVLKPNTAYSLYGMKNGETSVSKLLDFNTDTTIALGGTGTTKIRDYIDTTLEKGHITISVNPSERYIFPVQFDTVHNDYTLVTFYVLDNQLSINTSPISQISSLFYPKVVFMTRNLGTSNQHSMSQGYALIDTTGVTTDIEYGVTVTPANAGAPLEQRYSTLSPQ